MSTSTAAPVRKTKRDWGSLFSTVGIVLIVIHRLIPNVRLILLGKVSSRLGVDGHIDTIDRFVNRLGRLFVIFGIAWLVVIKERITVKASRDNGNNQLILQLGLERRTKDNVGIGRHRTSDNLGRFLNLGHTHIIATRHIKEYTLGTVDRHLDQW